LGGPQAHGNSVENHFQEGSWGKRTADPSATLGGCDFIDFCACGTPSQNVFSKFPQSRHPERSASQVYRLTGFLARSRRTPKTLVCRCSSELSGHKNLREIKKVTGSRDDKGEEGSAHLSSRYRGTGRAAAGYPLFSSHWVSRRPMTPPVEMTNPLGQRICHLDRSVPGFPATRPSPTSTCAAFSEESRMKLANASNPNRKSGVA
jgi:hypothetical protein